MRPHPTSITVKIWYALASVRLAVILLTLLSINLNLAYFSIKDRSTIFEPMNQVGIWSWLTTYAPQNLLYTTWFYIFLVLLTGLTVNTLVCTTDHLWRLLTTHLERRFYFSFAIHVMHLGMVVILSGYLASYTMTTLTPSITLPLGKNTTIPGTGLSIELQDMTLPVYQGNRLTTYDGRVISPTVQIKVTSSTVTKTADMGFNNPVNFQGYGLFLQRFSPKRPAGGISQAHYIVVDIRKDPGVRLYFIGIGIFLCGLLSYAIIRIRSGKPGKIS